MPNDDNSTNSTNVAEISDEALGSVRATLRGALGWRHAFGDVASTQRNRLVGGDPFLVRGAPVDRNAAVAEAGIDVAIGKFGVASLTYGSQFGERATDQRVRVNIRIKF